MKFKKFLNDNQSVLLASLLLSVSLFLVFPISVYQKNEGIIGFNLNDMWYIMIGLTAAGFIISAAISILVRQYLFKYLGVVYLAVVLCFWVQGNFLTYDLGVLDGREIDWSVFRNYYYVEAFLWVGGIAAAVWFRKRIQKDLTFLLIVVAILQVSPLVITSFEQTSKDGGNPSLYFNTEKEFEFSADKNVVIIVVDTARSDAFEQVLERNPKYRETFKDFTFFRNTVGGFSTTKASIPLILSGEYYDNSAPYAQYMQNTKSISLPKLLKKNGYTAEYYSFAPFAYRDEWSNISNVPSRSDVSIAAEKIYIIAFLRYLPLSFKPRILEQYYKGINYWGKDIVDLYNNASRTSQIDKSPVFKFVHITGAHPLFLLDASLKLTDNGSYLGQFEASLMAVDKLFNEMKSAGVYDNSLILIMGDHGSTETWSVPTKLQQTTTMLMLNGMPMLLAKRFNQDRTKLVVSDAPVSLSDIPKTVMGELQIENKLPGASIFADLPEDRVRIFYFYNHWQQKSSGEFLPPLYKFEVNGFVRTSSFWHFLGKVYTGFGEKDILSEDYHYGDNIVSVENFYIDLFSYGFRKEDRVGAWAMGPHSCIYLPVKKTKNLLSLSFSIQPYVDQKNLPQQSLNVLVDDHSVAMFNLKTSGNITVTIPFPSTYVIVDNQIKLCFDFPDAKFSPRDAGVSNDFRTYGGFFNFIVVNEITPFSLPSKFDFSKKGNTVGIKNVGWSESESEFTWTTEKNAQLFIPLKVIPSENLRLTVSALPFTNGEKLPRQQVIIRANGNKIGEWIMDHTGEYAVNIPPHNIVNGLLNLEFEMPNAVSPASLGLSQDSRVLGMAVRWMRLDNGETPKISLPAEFTFGDKGDANDIQGSGWANPEPEITWTTAQKVRLSIPLETPASDHIKLTISAMPFIVPEKIPKQLVVIRSNGREIGTWKMDHDGEYSISIPSIYIVNGILDLQFDIPTATSPVSLGKSQDTRILGMAVRWIKIIPQ